MDARIAATETIAATFQSPTVVVSNFPRRDQFGQVSPDLDGPRIIYVGGLARARGTLDLVEALAYLPGVKLCLAGTFSDPAFEAEVRESAGWRQVDYRGWLSRADVAKAMTTCALGLVPLRSSGNYDESFPTKMFEYMAAGLPVVATDLPAVRRILAATGAGIVVPPSDPMALANGVGKLLDDRSTLRLMSSRAREAVDAEYGWEVSERRLLRLYGDLLRGT
jgi:glycosyltransferase involved in cell wall biosynthesis